jgi:hypothetical protein
MPRTLSETVEVIVHLIQKQQLPNKEREGRNILTCLLNFNDEY